jgi:hypothetical protein
MRPTEIKDLVAGLLVIILLSITLGHYADLQVFARHEAAKSIKGWKPYYFFGDTNHAKGVHH